MSNSNRPLLTVCELGRIGDIVTAEPIFRYLKSQYPERTLRWYTKPAFAELLRYSPDVDEVVCVNDATEYLKAKAMLPNGTLSFELNFKPGSPSPAARVPRVTCGGTSPSLLEIFAAKAGLEVPEETPHFHFRPDFAPVGLPEKYVLFHCVSNGINRQWNRKNWNRLAGLFEKRGLPVVEIGIHPVLERTSELHIDRTGKLDLQLAAKIVQGAALLVGVESGFGHIANAVGTPAIILSGRLQQYPEYNFYSGRFRRGENLNIVRFFDVPADHLPYEVAEKVVLRYLDGEMMSYSECRIFCMQQQLAALQNNWFRRCVRKLTAPLDKLRRSIAFHYLRH